MPNFIGLFGLVREVGVQPTNKINELIFPTGQNHAKPPLWRQTTIPNFSQPKIGVPYPPPEQVKQTDVPHRGLIVVTAKFSDPYLIPEGTMWPII
jgi:hypothetical protein